MNSEYTYTSAMLGVLAPIANSMARSTVLQHKLLLLVVLLISVTKVVGKRPIYLSTISYDTMICLVMS